jgi:hypothetical protein
MGDSLCNNYQSTFSQVWIMVLPLPASILKGYAKKDNVA